MLKGSHQTLLHWQKFTSNNRGDQKVSFCLQNALNFPYGHQQFELIFSGGFTPWPPLKVNGGKGGRA
jgi:hypothetical protein